MSKRVIVDMRTRPPLATWVTKAQFRQGNVYYPTRVGFPRPPSAERRSLPLLVNELDDAGVQWAVIMGRQSAEPTGSIPNYYFQDRALYASKTIPAGHTRR